jgi:hypothetical protein
MIYLFKGDRITLIKSTFSNLHTYFMSLLSFLAGVANNIGIQGDYFFFFYK